MNWQNVLILVILPLVTVLGLFFAKRKLLWLAPFLSTALAFIAYMAIYALEGMQSPIVKIFGNNEWRAFFLLALLLHFIAAAAMTAAAYLVAYVMKRLR